MMNTTATAFSAARDFFAHRIAPYEPGDTIELRSFDPHDGKSGPRHWHTNAEEAARDAVNLARRYNVYAPVNPRIDGGGKKDHVTAIVSLHGEMDDQKFPGGRAGILTALEQLPPTLLIDSGGGVHPRWDLAIPLRLDGDPEQRAASIECVENLMRRIYRFLGGDSPPDSVQDVSRLLRIPGTLNRKPEYGTPRPVTVLAYHPDRRYDLDSLDALLPALPIVPPKAPPVHLGHPPVSADDRAVLDRARVADNGAKFSRLYDAGDWEGEGYRSRSEARAGLCSMIGFWVNRDPGQIETLFAGSALYDEKKWAREHKRVLDLACQGDFYRWPTTDARVPLSILDTPPLADDGVDYHAMPHDALARLAAELAALAAERGRRLDAIDELLLCPEMSETEKVTAYVIVKAAAEAQGRQPADAPTHTIVVNQKTMACGIGLSRQTIGKKLQIWSDQGYMRKETPGTGRFTKKGREITETVLSLPGRTLTDNLAMASTWHRPPDAKQHGGNGNRCPKCNSTAFKKTEETAQMLTTTIACADCGHVHETRTKPLGETKTYVEFGDFAADIPTAIDPEALRRAGGVSILDTPPIPLAPNRARARGALTPSKMDTPPVAALTPKDCGTGVHPATPPPVPLSQPADVPPFRSEIIDTPTGQIERLWL